MKNLKERWIKAIYNPFWWAVVLMIVIMVILFSGDGYGAGFEITIENPVNKTAVITVMEPGREDFVYKVPPKTNKNIPMDYGEKLICVGFERDIHGEMMADVHKCYPVEITEENLYDEDGHKMYFELSER